MNAPRSAGAPSAFGPGFAARAAPAVTSTVAVAIPIIVATVRFPVRIVPASCDEQDAGAGGAQTLNES